MRKLYIIRHGQTLFNERKLAQGWCDSPLTERGINQAKHVKSHLQDQNIQFDGESDVEAQSRFNDTIHEILDEGHENTLCVAHGGVMWLYFLKRNHPNDLKGETFGNCCILEYDVKDNNEVKFARLINPAQNV